MLSERRGWGEREETLEGIARREASHEIVASLVPRITSLPTLLAHSSDYLRLLLLAVDVRSTASILSLRRTIASSVNRLMILVFAFVFSAGNQTIARFASAH